MPAAPDYRDLVRALAEGVEIDEPRTTVELADQARPAITGIVRDLETGEPLAGATVVAVSPTIPGEQVVITDENGNYILDTLPGTYTVTLYYMYQTVVETDVAVAEGHATHLTEAMPTAPLRMPESPPADDLESIPVAGRTFEAALGAAAGSQDDGLGVSFSSHCGLENVYVVDSNDQPGSFERDQ